MNRSYSKIRHIQEANSRLERRLISEQQTQQNPNITQLVTKLKETPFYQETDNLNVVGNRVYYTGNINSTTKTGMFGKDKSDVGTLVYAKDPNARFFEWTGTGWKRGEQQNKYYDQTPVDLVAATTNFANLSVPQQNQNQNIAKN